jgi:hypothetical protein
VNICEPWLEVAGHPVTDLCKDAEYGDGQNRRDIAQEGKDVTCGTLWLIR